MKEMVEPIPTVTEEGVRTVTGAVRAAAASVVVAQQAIVALRLRAQAARAVTLSDMPRGGGGPKALDDYIVQLEEHMDRLAAVGHIEEQIIGIVAEIIARLADPEERTLGSIVYLSQKKLTTARATVALEQEWGGSVSERAYYSIKKRLLVNLQAVITPEDVSTITDLLALARATLRAPRAA